MIYQIGDKIAHPMHGAGVIEAIESLKIGGVLREYYVLKLPVGDMCVKIPKESCDKIGVRPVVDAAQAASILEALPKIEVSMTKNWSKRYQENLLRIKSGDLLEVAAVVKGLMDRDTEQGLSTGERKMLHSAKQILISEFVLSLGATYEEMEAQLTAAMS